MHKNFKQMVSSHDKSFKLFSNCKIVQGKSRSIICDFKGRVFIVPEKYNGLLQLLCSSLDQKYIEKNEVLKEFISELEYKKMGMFFRSEEESNFPEIELKWSSPYQITNAILDIDSRLSTGWEKFIMQLDAIGCPFVQIRVFGDLDFNQINSILISIGATEIYSVQIVIPNDQSADFWLNLSNFIQTFPRLVDVIVYNSNNVNYPLEILKGKVRLSNEGIVDEQSCGKIGPNYFCLNIPFFMESQLYNNCLNRKISLTKDGFIKNCPSMKKDYGNINQENLIDVFNNEDFRFWWTIKKDDIEVCRDCEFRYICSDCRAYTVRQNDPYSKPSLCTYDPYTCNGF